MPTTEGLLTGRPVSLHILDYGFFRVHAGPRDVGIMGALITTDAGEQVLVDTGFPLRYTESPSESERADCLDSFGTVLSCTPANTPAAQLALAGTTPDRISLVIQTHTHIDHAGHLDISPQAPMLIAAAERALPRPLSWPGAQHMDWPDRSCVEVTEDVAIGPGFQVLFCPGHSPGQLSLLIDLPETGPLLYTSDAISRPAEIDEAFAGSWDEAQAIHHGARLTRLAQERDAVIVWGHCPAQWHRLRKAPDAYR
ncbi:MBL fold metallo-hydrolase [Seohaeicola nanhaiensis]|uniref:MBL fold metallo-hydrolase n=1 Tax=Seohaeicola nanhaiensis TaxID=1387282 RepID=A0ABV9KEP9_9RHOB